MRERENSDRALVHQIAENLANNYYTFGSTREFFENSAKEAVDMVRQNDKSECDKLALEEELATLSKSIKGRQPKDTISIAQKAKRELFLEKQSKINK